MLVFTSVNYVSIAVVIVALMSIAIILDGSTLVLTVAHHGLSAFTIVILEGCLPLINGLITGHLLNRVQIISCVAFVLYGCARLLIIGRDNLTI